MIREGNIEVVESIEKVLRSLPLCQCIKGGPRGISPVRDGTIECSVYSVMYEVHVWPYLFAMTLRYDYRIRRGYVSTRDKNIEVLYAKYPRLVEALAKLSSVENNVRIPQEYRFADTVDQ